MKERPILFSGPMVRAIREGRKTQTRRLVKPQPDKIHDGEPYWYVGGYRAWKLRDCDDILRKGGNDLKCPYGKPGDRLWVKETFTLTQHNLPVYMADSRDKDGKFWPSVHSDPDGVLWKPSIHMPRRASRITLEIVGVRVERLQDISDEDAEAEGIYRIAHGRNGYYYSAFRNDPDPDNWCHAVPAYKELWESINGVGSWDLNQWVWVIEFKEVKP